MKPADFLAGIKDISESFAIRAIEEAERKNADVRRTLDLLLDALCVTEATVEAERITLESRSKARVRALVEEWLR